MQIESGEMTEMHEYYDIKPANFPCYVVDCFGSSKAFCQNEGPSWSLVKAWETTNAD